MDEISTFAAMTLAIGAIVVVLLIAILRRLTIISAQLAAGSTYNLMIDVVTRMQSVEERLVSVRNAVDQVEQTTSRLIPPASPRRY